ncbi:ribose-phosphate pyrophosphokinase [Striga asiatica]|uniref:Ribose-phosphate pyrophosphokinase n=1 Tax=Striga asiatica TaxID=4170 RepID=A0A5A7QVT4_STRAF|nr:ribose-phosphate pyrophosphokinase [Striga asiatica]
MYFPSANFYRKDFTSVILYCLCLKVESPFEAMASATSRIIVAFPDDGAWKRFHKLFDHFPMVICNKVREGDKRIVRIKEGNPAGCHVVIVDDLVQSGGTLIECQMVGTTVDRRGIYSSLPLAERSTLKRDEKVAFQRDGVGKAHLRIKASSIWDTESHPVVDTTSNTCVLQRTAN